MTHDSTPHRIFKISELTRLIAGQLVLISRQSAVNLACACRSLEEPILSTLWEMQWSLFTLLEVLPRETREYQYLEGGKYVVRGLDPPPEGLKFESLSRNYFSLSLWGIHHRRIGIESGATRLGCAEFVWTSGDPSEKKHPKNYTPIYLLVDGSQHCEIYLGASLNSVSFTPTYSSLRICRAFPSARHGHGIILVFPSLSFQPWFRSSPRCRHRAFDGYRWTPAIRRCPGHISKSHSLLSFCVADHHLRNTTPRFHCRTTHWTT